MRFRFLPALLACVALAAAAHALDEHQRRDYLQWMKRTLPDDPAWNVWQQKTGELPPDFDALPRSNLLPDPLRMVDGRAVRNATGWAARRAEIRQLMEKWDVGSIPPKPKLDAIVPLEDSRGPGYVTRRVRLEYGPERKATTNVTVVIPDGRARRPVLVGFGWTAALIRRGYISCSFDESVDRPSNLPELYPGYDFGTMGQRAWTAQMVVDYLLTLPEVDPRRIAITGYSRGGKMATIAAALDERIAAVIAGSTGVGGILPWRLSGERGNGEGIETTTRMFPLWFHPRLRFFAGHEDRLPFDGNLLVALVAPRACLMEYGLNDEVSNCWGSEQTYASAIKVYRMLGRPDGLGILRLPGFHGANDQELCLDWLDEQFGRSGRKWSNAFLFPWNFDAWKTASNESAAGAPPAGHPLQVESRSEWETNAVTVKKAVRWVLGDEPPRYMPPPGVRPFFIPRGPTSTATKPVPNPGQLAPDVPGWVIARNSIEFGWSDPDRQLADSRRIEFGANVTGDLYFPKGVPAGKRLPTVIWLHGYSYPLGYMWVYRRDLHPILALVKAGYAVLAYDQCGFGRRLGEIGPFYDRWPHWSQIGRMVEDVGAAIDTLEKDAVVDPNRIYLFGYTLGGAVALHAAAFDPRVKSVVAVCGFTPMRTDTAAKGTSGVARYSLERPTAPRLGFFIGHEAAIPYDYDELIACVAPRPVLVVQPQCDRDATPADVRAAVERARRVYALYGAASKLALDEPDDIARLPTATLNRIIAWLGEQSSIPDATTSEEPRTTSGQGSGGPLHAAQDTMNRETHGARNTGQEAQAADSAAKSR